MSTRSTIWVQTGNTLKGIYCHNDGYLDGVGETLLKYYNTLEKVQELISLGSLSVLAENIKPTGGLHNFDNPQNGVTIAYHRDRGEDLEIIEFDSRECSVDKFLKENLEEFNYFFIDNEWFVSMDDSLNKNKLSSLIKIS